MAGSVLALISLGLSVVQGGAERPPSGTMLLTGTVKSVDLKAARVVMDVESTLLPSGVEGYHPTPVSQPIDVKGAQLVRGSGSPLKPVDLKTGMSASAIVVGTRLGETPIMPARELRVSVPPPRPVTPRLEGRVVEPDGVCRDPVLVPLVFPVLGNKPPADTWLAGRDGGVRRHLGQDMMAPQLAPLVACFDGVVYTRSGGNAGHYRLTLVGDNGWTAEYMHLNNDRPGTNDGQGGPEYAFAPGIRSGQRVVAGQLLGYNGNSGNAERTGHHLHFELWYEGAVYNAHPSLHGADRLAEPRANRSRALEAPESGLVRVDGEIIGFDPARRVLTMRVAAEQRPGKSPTVPLAPTRRYVDLSDTEFLALIDGDPNPSFADLASGQEVIVFGRDQGVGKALIGKRLRTGFRSQIEPPPLVLRQPAPESPTAPPPASPPPTQPPVGNLLAPDAKVAETALDAINAYRRRYRAADLRRDPGLDHVAMNHAKLMLAEDFLDAGPRGDDPLALAKRAGFPGGKVALFIAGEEEDAWRAVLRWLREPKAREAMLSPLNHSLGVGFVEDLKDEGNVKAIRYWVIMLGGP